MKRFITIILIFSFNTSKSQNIEQEEVSYESFINQVKEHHPLVKQANLVLDIGEANLLKSKGGFDPKIDVDWKTKEFKGSEYYNQLNSTFKIPTWYGVELKAGFEQNAGDFLNPSLKVPDNGLFSAGVSLSLAQGLLMNDRMATLKSAQIYKEQSKVDRELLINQIIYEASIAYLEWLQMANEERIVINSLANASQRFSAIKRNIETGEMAAIDSLEAKITLQNRELSYEAIKLKRVKSALKASTFLWIEQIPIEIKENVYPSEISSFRLKSILFSNQSTDSIIIDLHPKIQSLQYKFRSLDIDRKLKQNKLLPKLNVQYNFLTEDYNSPQLINSSNYKAMANFSLPIFLRKERGDLKLAKLKLQNIAYERLSESLQIQNKIKAINNEINSLLQQEQMVSEIVVNYEALVKGEERKFFMGESSLFIINSRERSLITALLKENIIKVKKLTATMKLFNAYGKVSPKLLN